MTGEFDVRQVKSVLDVPAAEWGSLATSLYSSRAWHRFQEIERDDISSTYLLAYGKDGQLAAALPLYHVRDETHRNYQLEHVFPAAGVGGGGQVLLGNRHGYTNTLLARPGLTPGERREAFRCLLDAAIETLGRQAVDTAWWPYLDDASMRTLLPLANEVTPVAMKNDCSIPLFGEGFDDYLESLPSGRRTSVRKERKTFAHARYSVSASRLSASAADIARLGAETAKKHRGSLSPESAAMMVARQTETLDDLSTVFACATAGQLVGFALVLDFAGVSHVRTAGFDYARILDAYEYFELAFYRPIEHAYVLGCTQVRVGVSSYRAKILRGGRLHARWALPLRTAHWPEPAARRHNGQQMASYEQELESLEAAIPYASYDKYC